MIDQKDSEKVNKIIKEYKSSSNKDLIFAMDFIQNDFNFTLNYNSTSRTISSNFLIPSGNSSLVTLISASSQA